MKGFMGKMERWGMRKKWGEKKRERKKREREREIVIWLVGWLGFVAY